MLRLDPALVPLWRDATTLQFGAHAHAVLQDVEPWQERLLRELQRGFPESGLDVWADLSRIHSREVRAFLDRLGRAVLRSDTERAAVIPRLFVETPRGAARSVLARAVITALEGTGARVGVWERRRDGDDAPYPRSSACDAVVLLADHVLDPGTARAHLAADRTHLPVVATGTGVTVGPLIVPGVTPCGTCLDLARRDADADWPALAAQLLGAPPVPVPADLAHEAAAETVRLISAAGGGPARASELRRDGTTQARLHPPHPRCGCRALPGTATAPVPRALPGATTTVKRFAVPA